MHASFLSNGSMSVKIGMVMSKPREVTGGAVQGSVLGVLDHNVVLNNLDDDLLDVYVAKYIDDMTIIDTVNQTVRTEIDSTGNRQRHTAYPPATQNAFNKISENTSIKGLRINAEKTQILSVSSSFYGTKAHIKDSNDITIESSNNLKILGFCLITLHLSNHRGIFLIRKASKRYFLLLHYKRSGLGKEKLKEVYCAMTRSILRRILK